ncbi:MAG TPA: class I SAM-dependent methyltransferase [Pirellulales bacterium]|jgi:SAM-dependent methyltransferase|nr:class I SAM-dependent methyltransferase [Pirellulales bacterium]
MSMQIFSLTDGSDRTLPTAVQVLHAERDIFFRFFDDVQQRLERSLDEATVHQALDEVFLALKEKKLNTPDAEWQPFIAQCRQHPLAGLLHQDPFTYRAFSKPRGYAGDAVMMDYIYGREEQWPLPHADPLGQAIFEYTTSAPASEGVRARRAFIAARIDRLAEELNRPHILAVAAGHLREVSLSAAVRRRRTGRFVALDADPESSAEVRRSYSRFGVETLTASFRRLLTESHGSGEFDFVYSTGLFDYLNQRAGQRLVTSMFRMLRPGGTLLVANFLPGIRDIGYMETFMDWRLVYRSRRDMVELTMDIPEEEVKQVTVFSEECRNIVFLQLTRM